MPREAEKSEGIAEDADRFGLIHLDGWSGRTTERVRIVGETPQRYRVEAITRTRLAGRCRWLAPGDRALVPKRAVSIEA
jgi:hypothetical protein